MIARVFVLALFLVGLTGLLFRRNLIKKVYSLGIMNTSIVLLFILGGGEIGTSAPLFGGVSDSGGSVVDPVPQALMLTAIVVGMCVSALSLALAYRLYRLYGSLDAEILREKAAHD